MRKSLNPLLAMAVPLLIAAAPSTGGPINSVTPPPMTAWSMFLAADWVVKLVMAILIAASVVTWAVCFARSVDLRRIGQALREDRARMDRAADLGALTPMASAYGATMVAVARDEVAGCSDLAEPRRADAMMERLSIRLTSAEADAAQSMRSGLAVFASIGAVSPFVGLFGTVWGIMRSFIGISQAQTTNLAVVAPGIAEALLATALGLVAAIPAVLIYNMLTRRVAGLKRELHHVAMRAACLVSHEVERAQAARSTSVPQGER